MDTGIKNNKGKKTDKNQITKKLLCCTSLGLPPGLRDRLLAKSGECPVDMLSWLL